MSKLGERLRQAREARGISPLQVEIDTRIRATLIQALEQGDFENLPPEPFLRGLIRTYSTYLGVDSEEMLNLYVSDFTPTSFETTPRPSIVKKPSQSTPSQPPQSASSSATPPPPRVSEPVSLPPPSTPETVPPWRAMPPPMSAPEKLLPQDTPPPSTPEDSLVPRLSLAHFTRRPAPLPVIVLIGLAVVLVCIVGGIFLSSQVVSVARSVTGLDRSATPTRLPPSRTPTILPGAIPTNIPTLVATAPPFATFPGNPTATPKATARRTLETYSDLNFDVDVTQVITLQVGIDGVLVFNGQLTPGTSRSWKARDSLYVRVENPKGATLTVNGNNKLFAARNFAETKVVERQWTLNDKGAAVGTTPVPPVPLSSAGATPTLSPPPVSAPTFTPTMTPFS